MLGVPTFNVSKITKNPFYTLNIDHITKLQEFNVKSISIRRMKLKKNQKYCLTMVYLSLKYCGNPEDYPPTLGITLNPEDLQPFPP